MASLLASLGTPRTVVGVELFFSNDGGWLRRRASLLLLLAALSSRDCFLLVLQAASSFLTPLWARLFLFVSRRRRCSFC